MIKSKHNTVKSWKKNCILIDTNKLKDEAIYNLDIILKLNKRIIRGTVYNTSGFPVANAVIVITEFDYGTKFKRLLGYCYTDRNGKYVACIEISPYYFYEIDIYSPLDI